MRSAHGTETETLERLERVVAALQSSAPWKPDTSLAVMVFREHWRKHEKSFTDCQQVSCLLLKRVAEAVGWKVGLDGIQP